MAKGHKNIYTPAMLAVIADNYMTLTDRQITAEINKQFDVNFDVSAIKSKRKNMGLHSGRTGRFYKGQPQPKNSGAKEANKTSFKKGDRPHNWRPVGSERISIEGYIEIKVAEGQPWRHKQKEVWEQHHGKIPRGDVIRFIDGNPLNCKISNLEKISRQEHMAFNKAGVNDAHDDIKPTLKLICKLDVKTRQMLNA